MAAGYGCAPVMFGCWVIYLSFTTVGETFLYFQWDSLLCEVGFLAFLYAPLLGRPSQSTTTSRVVLWMLRFLLFKFVLMSGVVKVASNDRSWRDLTALEYQLASQAIPTPAAWYARQLHPLLLQLFVAATFVIEIPIGILILCPFRMVRHAVAACLVCLQVSSPPLHTLLISFFSPMEGIPFYFLPARKAISDKFDTQPCFCNLPHPGRLNK